MKRETEHTFNPRFLPRNERGELLVPWDRNESFVERLIASIPDPSERSNTGTPDTERKELPHTSGFPHLDAVKLQIDRALNALVEQGRKKDALRWLNAKIEECKKINRERGEEGVMDSELLELTRYLLLKRNLLNE